GGGEAKHAEAKKDDGKKEENKPQPGGIEGDGPLFENGIEFDYNGNKARVWAHPHCFSAGPRPLVIALHGINGKTRKLYPALDENGIHVGKLAGKLIDDGKV